MHKCFADLTSAFDLVPRELLFKMLEFSGVPPNLLRLITNLHNNSRATIRWDDGSMSDAFDLSCGLKQGAVYSPLLFAIYFNFITTACKRKFQQRKLGVTIRLRKETKEDRVMVQNKNGSIVTFLKHKT